MAIKRKSDVMMGAITEKPPNSINQVTMTAKEIRSSLHNAVFLTTELLGMILEYLPMRDLLLAQRVTSKWRDVIARSTRMQQTLFFQPRGAEAFWRCNLRDSLVRVNANHKLGVDEQLLQQADVNPLVFMIDTHLHLHSIADVQQKAAEGGVVMEFVPGIQHESWRYPNASWRRMLVTQPPLEQITGGEIACAMKCDQGTAECPCCQNLHFLEGSARQSGLRASDIMDYMNAGCPCDKTGAFFTKKAAYPPWVGLSTELESKSNVICLSKEREELIDRWNAEFRIKEAWNLIEKAEEAEAAAQLGAE